MAATLKKLLSLKSAFAKAAQRVYDDWDEEDESFGGGGICDLIAEEIGGVLDAHGFEAASQNTQIDENHTWALARVTSGTNPGWYMVDIPPYVYERGSGYSWTKIPDVEFDESDLVIAWVDDADAEQED